MVRGSLIIILWELFRFKPFRLVSRQAIAFLVSRFEMQKKDVPNSIFEMLGISKTAAK